MSRVLYDPSEVSTARVTPTPTLYDPSEVSDKAVSSPPTFNTGRLGKVVDTLAMIGDTFVPSKNPVLTQPLSKSLGGFSGQEAVEKLFPENAKDASKYLKNGFGYDVLRRGVKTVGGFVDWLQSPLGIATSIAHATSAGADTVLAPLLGAKFTKEAYDSGKVALDDMSKNGATPENVEQYLSAWTQGLFGTAFLKSAQESATPRPEVKIPTKGDLASIADKANRLKPPIEPEPDSPMIQRMREIAAEQDRGMAAPPPPAPIAETIPEPESGTTGQPVTQDAAPAEVTPAESVLMAPGEVSAKAAVPQALAEAAQPAVEPSAEQSAVPQDSVRAPMESTLSSFLEDTTALKTHPARPAEARTPEEYANFEKRIRKAGEDASSGVLADYIGKLRDTAETHAPDNAGVVEHIKSAEEALHSGRPGDAAWEAEQARGKGGLSSEYQTRVAREAYRRATGEEPPEIPAEESKPTEDVAAEIARLKTENEQLKAKEPIPPKRKPKALRSKIEPPAKTPYDSIAEDTAHSEMQAWADAARSGQERLKSGESAMTMASNVEGKEIEEEANRQAAEVGRSLGAKENSPLAKFSEPPGALASAIEKGKGKLYDRIVKAFTDAVHDSHGDAIREHLAGESGPFVDRLRAAIDEQSVDRPVTVPELKAQFPDVPKAEFDAAVMQLAKDEKIYVSRHDHPGAMPEDFRRDSLVDDQYVAVQGGRIPAEDISFDFGANVIDKLDEAAEKTKVEIKAAFQSIAKGETFGANLPVELFGKLAKYGALKLAKGTVKFAQWSKEMLEEMGEGIRPYLREVYKSSHERVAPLMGLSAVERSRLPASVVENLATSGDFDAVGKLLINMSRATTKRSVLERAYGEERSKRAAALSDVMAKQKGQEGHFEALGRLKGEMAADKKTFDLPFKLEQADVDALFRQIQAHPEMRPFDKVSTSDGLQKLLNGQVPAKSQIRLLRDVFGPEFEAAIPPPPLISKLRDLFTEVVNVPRAIMASFDMSAALRQGVIFTTTKPQVAAASFKEMFRQVFSPENFRKWNEGARKDPMFPLMEESGLYMADPLNLGRNGELAQREERFMSNLAERIPIIGAGVRASERAYIGYLNKMRFDVFKDLATKFQREGIAPETNPKAYESLASFVNNATGRGDLGKLNRVSQELNTVFFSPKLIAARFHMLNPAWYMKQARPVRTEAIKSMAQFVGTGMTILALMKASGAQVETDPRSTDFGKIKIGNTRWDIWGGFQQWARATAQIVSGQRKNSKGDLYKLSPSEFPFETRKDVAERFGVSKFAPMPRLAYELLLGQKQFGEALTLSGEAAEDFVPLYLQDVRDAVAEQGPSAIVSVGVPSFFGVGTQTYKEKAPSSAIHSTIAGDISDKATDLLMKNLVSVGRVERQVKDESAESLRLRSKVVATLINEFVGDLELDPADDADSRHALVKKTEEKARQQAADVFRHTKQMGDDERKAYLQEWLNDR